MSDSKNETTFIREFIYLDTDKLISLSSQLFEGFIESVTSDERAAKSKSEEQKGPLASGEKLGVLLKSEQGRLETRSISDYAFTMLEAKLKSKGMLAVWDSNSPAEFVQVSGKAILQDIPKIVEMIRNFNDTGRNFAITQAVNLNSGELVYPPTESQDRNQNAKAKAFAKSIKGYSAIAREMGMQMDDDGMKAIASLLEGGHKDALEVIIPIDDDIFSAPLDRSYLRQDLDLILRRYGRRTERELTIVGRVCRSGEEMAVTPTHDGESMRGILLNVQQALVEIDEAMNNRLPNEIVLDPLAIFVS